MIGVNYLTSLITQISASRAKFHSKSVVFGKIVVFDLKLTQNLETHSKFWELTQILGEQFQGIEVVVTSKIADNLDLKRLVSWC